MRNIMIDGKFNHLLIPFRDNKTRLYGYLDEIGRIIIKAKYYDAHDFEDDGYAIVKLRNGYYTLIDNSGFSLSHEEYLYIGEPIHRKRIVARKNNNLLDRNTNKLLYGIIGDINIPCKYIESKLFENGMGYIKDSKDRYYIIGSTISKSYLESRPINICSNGLVQCENGKCYLYSEISSLTNKNKDIKLLFTDLDVGYGFTYDKKLGKYTAIVNVKRTFPNEYDSCVIDENGIIIIAPILCDSYENYCYRLSRNNNGFYDGIFIPSEECNDKRQKYGVVNSEGEVIVPIKYYNKAEILDNLIIIDNDYYDYDGNKIEVNKKYKNIEYSNNSDVLIATLENGKKVYLDTSFNELFNSYEFDYCEFSNDGVIIAGNYKIDSESNDNYKYMEYKVFRRERKHDGAYITEELFTYPKENEALYEVENLKHFKYNKEHVFYGYFKNKFGSVIIHNGKVKKLDCLVLRTEDKFFITYDYHFKGLVTLDGVEVLPMNCEDIRQIGEHLFLITPMLCEGHAFLNTNMHDYPTGSNKLEYFDYYYNENIKENIIKELNSPRDFVLRNYNFNHIVDCYDLEYKNFLKIPITKDELFEIVDKYGNYISNDNELDTHYQIREEYKNILKYFDLRDVDFKNVDVRGIDFSETNAKINPRLVYNCDISGCKFNEKNLISVSKHSYMNIIDESETIDGDSLTLKLKRGV